MKNYLYNMLINLKNGQYSKRQIIFQERKKSCEMFLKILWSEGFILGYKINRKNINKLEIFLKYSKHKPAINSLRFLSKPSKRVYYSSKQISKIDSSKLFIIFSTAKGLKSILQCKQMNIGGEAYIIIN